MPRKKKTKKVKKLKKQKKILVKKSKIEVLPKKQISSNQEDKPEIKKIKKQATEKKQYNVKDFVVYPKHGVGKIIAVEKAKIGQIEIQFYKILLKRKN